MCIPKGQVGGKASRLKAEGSGSDDHPCVFGFEAPKAWFTEDLRLKFWYVIKG